MPDKLKYPVGCPKCSQTGFNGQIALIEILRISDEIETMILEEASSLDITKKALEQGMITLAEDGVLKVLEGVTAVTEIGRVA